MERPPITPNMRISDLVKQHPETLRVLRRHGIRCEDCHASRYESIGHGAQVHNLDLALLLTDLNQAARGPSTPPTGPKNGPGAQTHV